METNGSVKGAFVMLKPELIQQLADQIWEAERNTAALGNPLRVVAWLANKLAEYGECLDAGEIVITGSLNPAVYINAGDRFVADFGPLGKIQANFI